MELDFNKTYSNVKFFKWERFCYNEKDKDKFIVDIKNENPEVIIVKEEKNHDFQNDGDTLVTITGVQIIEDILKDYSFIEDFAVHTKRDLDVYVDSGHALLFWRNFHRDENVPNIEKIRSLFEVLRDIVEEESHRNVAFDYLRKKIYELKPLLRSTRDTEMLSQDGIDRLNDYNRDIKKFQDKFKSVERDLAGALEIDFNFDKDEYEYEEE